MIRLRLLGHGLAGSPSRYLLGLTFPYHDLTGFLSPPVSAVLAALCLIAPAFAENTPPLLSNDAAVLGRSLEIRAQDVWNVRDAPFGATGNGSTDDTKAVQAAATAIASVDGGTLYLPRGRYLFTSTVHLSSGTAVRCDGATIVAPVGASLGPFFTNMSYGASAISDHDISITGCSFQYRSKGLQNTGHAIEFKNAEHISIRDNRFDGGGDATAMLRSADIDIRGNVATNIQNTCYDHWWGTSNFRVIDNSCYLSEGQAGSFGIQATGLSTLAADTPVLGGQIIGNRIHTPGAQGACINLNSSNTSLVSRIQVLGNYCYISNGAKAPSGIILAGRVAYNIISANIIEGSNDGPAIIQTDMYGSDVIIADNIILNGSFSHPHRGNIEVNGARNIVSGNKFVNTAGPPIYASDTTTLIVNNDTGNGAASSSVNTGIVTGRSGLFDSLSGNSLLGSTIYSSSLKSSGGIGSVVISSGGVYYSSPLLQVAPPGDGGLPAEVAVSAMKLSTASNSDIVTSGSGYTAGCFLTVLGGERTSAAYVKITAVDRSGAVTGVSAAGQGEYAVLPRAPQSFITDNCSGTGFTMFLKWFVSGVHVNSPGALYSNDQAIVAVGGNGAGFAATGVIAAKVTVGSSGANGSPLISAGALVDGSGIRTALGGTYTVPSNTSLVRFTQTATLPSSTVALPTALSDGYSIQFVNYSGIIQSLTFSPSVHGWTNGSTLSANTGLRVRWDATALAWYREE